MLRRQHAIYLTFMNYTILNLQLLPPGYAVARKDLWLSFLISSFIAVALSWVIWRLERKFPGQTWLQTVAQRIHPVIRSIALLALSTYTLSLCVITTTQLTEFINIGFLQETPFWVIAALFAVSIVHAVRKGLMGIANVAALLTFSTAVTGTIMSIAITGNRHVFNILPIAEYGITPILRGILYCLPIWVELFFIPVLPRKDIGAKSWLMTYWAVVAINTVVIVGHIMSPVTTFGMEQSLNLNFPMLSSVKTISLGYIDRFDVYGLALMIFGCYTRTALYLVVTLMQLQSALRFQMSSQSWPVVVTAGAIIFSASLMLFRNTTTLDALVNQWLVYGSLGVLALFACLYLYLGVFAPRPQTSSM